ncbi:MAG: hypothetical protein PHR06_11080 [Candidatus Cloacimonetes bacterium]|nr:hypothetical protein [Candidatus Cloacimonadota bacterium]
METKKKKITKRDRGKILELLREFYSTKPTMKQVLNELSEMKNKPVTVKN